MKRPSFQKSLVYIKTDLFEINKSLHYTPWIGCMLNGVLGIKMTRDVIFKKSCISKMSCRNRWSFHVDYLF